MKRRQKFYTDVVQRQTRSERFVNYIVLALIAFILVGVWYVQKFFTTLDETDYIQDARQINEDPPGLQDRQPPIEMQGPEIPVSKPETVAEGDYSIIILNPVSSGFEPVNFKASSSSQPFQTRLGKDRFEALVNEPAYTGHTQWYGWMSLGNRPDRPFYFVLDQQDSNQLLMYFDANANNDLSDDGEPLVNRGSGNGGPGGFATPLQIPWKYLIEPAPYEGNFDLWFYSNLAGWQRGQQVSHYSRTQLQGNIEIAGKTYLAILVDQGYNDADLTNDGIIIDLNGNGKFDREEHAGQVHTIDGKQYRFEIHW